MKDMIKIKEEIDQNAAKLERARGVLDNVKAELKRDHGFKTIEKAEDHLESIDSEIIELKQQVAKLQQKITDELEAIENAAKKV